ncbi:MAG: metallophosphoesterase [Pseudomonadota bacterium]
MRVRDIGPLDEPVVLFGGPYSNLQALEALSQTIGERPAICTGDVVGYCADPVATVDLMRAMAVHCIAGNCERQVAEGGLDCGCGFEAGSTCDRLSQGWYSYLSDTCDPDTIAWLADQPEIGVLTQFGRRYGVVHGGVTAISRFIWPDTPDEVFLEEISALENRIGQVDGVIAGHCGVAFHRRIGRHQWINAGVIGLPPHDGRPATRYGILTKGDVVFERLSYDHASARKAMRAAGLTQGYEETLTTGIWPSDDVLPFSLRR